ncbi:High osmolarity signaling protein-like protein [Hapsidospora chrysogenum ATCC 11550]|uniref:High osmolarity signaling protein-like protein n=1 Tax=Hapsidospora chrysogenum (strain ATCC 11550 / CBS 779.69 / DSM 880 / IAM 14645 / JCM 23072 / IMI 49137) TaxID=857340 RepID=A0A086SYL4_HAPC1|nr:High osmolarity signaling protein-like protein [Hapsidospora chrysogenum ATCC 11550]
MENSRGYGSRRKGIQMGNILGDPFALATISISMLAWVIAFISFIVSAVQEVSDEERVNKFGWWSGVYALLLNIIVFVVVASDTIHTYHVAISSYCAVGLVLSSIAIQNLIYWPIGSRQASAAGFVLLAIIQTYQTIWIFYFGSTPSSTPRAFLDSFALAKESTTMHRQTMNPYGGTGRPETSNSVQPPQMYTSAQLNGFENPSPVGGTTQVNGARNSTLEAYGSTLQPHKSAASPGADTEEVVPPTEYPYRAKAIYSYEANPADANEISFTKHEVLEVSDVSGRWWQARKSNGDTGIAPSNYLILL